MTKPGMLDDRAGAPQQADRRQRRAAGGDQIVDQQHLVAVAQHVGMDLDRVDAIFERVVLPDRRARQLAASCGSARSPTPSAMATPAPKMKPRASMPATWVMPSPRCAAAIRSTLSLKPCGMLDQRGDVAKQDALLGIVRDRADSDLRSSVMASASASWRGTEVAGAKRGRSSVAAPHDPARHRTAAERASTLIAVSRASALRRDQQRRCTHAARTTGCRLTVDGNADDGRRQCGSADMAAPSTRCTCAGRILRSAPEWQEA